MRFLFLNQYAPPDPAPTARLLGDLADFLRANGHEVATVSQQQNYHGRPARGAGRLRREIGALLTIFRSAWRATRRKPDVILALSSPPGLLAVAAVVARLRGVRLAHWAMDLYPELALALGEIGPGIPFRAVRAAMGWAYRRTDVIVALDEDMRAHLHSTYGVESLVLAPWPPPAFEPTAPGDGTPISPTEPWTWLYSGNLGRAHEWETLLDAQRHLEARGLPIRLLFQGDGAARPAAIERARQLALGRCEWTGYADSGALAASLLAARLLVVTQRLETRGLLWPSKLAALEKLPRPLLFVGPTDGAIATRLRARGAAGIFVPGQGEAVADWIAEQFQRREPPPGPCSTAPGAADGCAQLERWLAETPRRARRSR